MVICLALSVLLSSPQASNNGTDAAKPLLLCREFNSAPSGWSTWAPRAEIAPKFDIERNSGRQGKGSLRITSQGEAAVGCWKTTVPGIRGGKTYRFSAWCQPRDVADIRKSVSARLIWLDSDGHQSRPPDYAGISRSEGGWTCFEQTCEAPPNASSVEVDLGLQWCANGQVCWDEIRMVETAANPGRSVRVMTLYYRPTGSKSAADNVERFCGEVEQRTSEKPDLICLPEGIPVVGIHVSYAEASQPIPGPFTQRLGETAKHLHSYLVAGLYEREGNRVYNTAVLMGRNGEFIGKYRKTHLPREEVEGGITPGNEYPVFQTDFGKVGLMICWDVQFPEPARAMALKGAEILLLPIWGGSEVLAKARAIENHAFLVSSSYDMKTFIVNPAGEVLAEATKENPAAIADLHLDQKIIQPWLGDMKVRTWRERRGDIPVESHR